jgi:hypothetical protein
MKTRALLLTGVAALFLATGTAHAGYYGNEKWTFNGRYCLVEKLTAPGPGNESGYLEWGEKNLLLMSLGDVLELQKSIRALKQCEAFHQCVAERDGYIKPKGKKPKHCYTNDRRWRDYFAGD